MSRIKQNLALLFAICCVSFAGPLIKVALLLAMPPVAVAFFVSFSQRRFCPFPTHASMALPYTKRSAKRR